MIEFRASCFARCGALAAPLALLAALPAPAAALQQRLEPSAATYGAAFGRSVAIEGDTAVIGMPEDGFVGPAVGAVLVFARSGGLWTQVAKLTASDGANGDALGKQVAIDGDTIVVGAPGDDGVAQNQGAVYTFARDGAATRTQLSKLTATDGAADDRLGSSVAISGATIAAGSPADAIDANLYQGSVYTFARSGLAARSQTAKLTASDGDGTYLALGTAVAIDGDMIVAGAPGDAIGANGFQGSVYTFASSGAAARSQTGKLTVSDGDPNDAFGSSVDIDGDTIVAGAPRERGSGGPFNTELGAAYTFARGGASQRTETAKLTAISTEQLGASIAIAGDTIAAGAPYSVPSGESGPSQGSVHVWARSGAAARIASAKLVATGGYVDTFGASVALDGTHIIAGAPDDRNASDTGAGFAIVDSLPLVAPVIAPPPTPVAPPPPPPPPPAALHRPSVSRFAFAPRSIVVGPRATAVAARAGGGRFTYVLSLPAAIRIVIERKLAGHRAGGRCVSPRRGAKRNCSRYVRRGALRRAGRPGQNTLVFSGRIGKRALAPGSYRATIVATNSAGASAARTTSLKVARASRRR